MKAFGGSFAVNFVVCALFFSYFLWYTVYFLVIVDCSVKYCTIFNHGISVYVVYEETRKEDEICAYMNRLMCVCVYSSDSERYQVVLRCYAE